MGGSKQDGGRDDSFEFVMGVLLITFAVIAAFVLLQVQLSSVLGR